MAFNDNYRRPGNAFGSSRPSDRPTHVPQRQESKLPSEIQACSLPADYVDKAESVIRKLFNDHVIITTSKIRNILSLVSDIYNTENLRTAEELLAESKTAVMMMRIRVVYEAGREDSVKSFVREAKLLEYIKDIGSSRPKLIEFAHYMEALVAYHRYYGGKEG